MTPVPLSFSVDGSAQAGDDYSPDAGTYTFAGTDDYGSILIDVVDDTEAENDEQFTLTLSGAANATLDRSSAIGTIADDDSYQYLTLEVPSVANSDAAQLTEPEVQPLAREAARRWSLVGAVPSHLRTILATVDIRIADLPGSHLGAAGHNRLLLDVDAAGYGWFIDSSPRDDREFQKIVGGSELQASGNSAAAGKVDLLTVVMHEFGHLLGLPDLPTAAFPHHIMTETVGLGTRRTPDSLSHRLDPHVPNHQPPRAVFDVLPTGLASTNATDESGRYFDALDQALADEDSPWSPVDDTNIDVRLTLDKVLREFDFMGR